jgi:hypothetical protein
MSWLFSQALVEEYSEASSLDGAQSAQSSGSHTQQAYCAPDKMTAFSRLSPSGMMFKPLTATHGQALLMSYLEAFRAKTSQSRGGGAGIDGERSGMWREMARIIHEVRPGFVFVENSPMLTSRGLGTVLGDLAAMGFDAKWGVLGAADIGANHQRDRIWIVAKMADSRRELRSTGDTAELDSEKKIRPSSTVHNQPGSEGYGTKQWWQIEPSVARMGDGVAFALDRSKAIGNGQVPLCAATAWRILNEQ